MNNRNVGRILLGLLALGLLLSLCGVTAAGLFWVARSGVESGSVSVREERVEPEEVVEEAEPTQPLLPEVEAEGAGDTPAADEPETEGAEADSPETGPTEEALDAPAAAAEDEAFPGRERDGEFTEEDLEIMWEAWQIIEEEFDGELPDEEELSQAIIRGMLEALDDDFTGYLPPDAAERVRESASGEFEGIGAFVRENEEGLTEIVRPMEGQPADLAGLRAGDVVIEVDGESVVEATLDEVIALIKGPEGTDVTLTVEREGEAEPLVFEITRARIEIPVVEAEMREDGIAYLRLSTFFNRSTDSQMREALAELLAENPRGLIFDLRDNGGGYLDQSVAVADAFLPEGVVLYERSSTLGIDEVYRSDSGDLAEEIPLVVLVNAGSASASEIVAGAIQDNERGVLIGETTFGKGSVQQPNTLSDGSELRVTIARWYIPSNRSIDGVGITPDIEVETPEEFGTEADTQLQRALEYLLETES